MKNYRFLSKKTIIGGSVIFIAFLFILMAFSPALAGTGQGIQPATAEKSYIPNPEMNTNITWSTFHNGWTPLEYAVNGTANATLNTGLSTIYANPISVNPTDIQSPILQTEKIDGSQWQNLSKWVITENPGGFANTVSNTSTTVAYTGVSDNPLGGGAGMTATYEIPVSALPSTNPAYDYVTFDVGFTKNTSDAWGAQIGIGNATSGGYIIGIASGHNLYMSESLAQITAQSGIEFNTSAGAGYTPYITVNLQLNAPPDSVNSTNVLTLSALGISEIPYTLGTQTQNGSQVAITTATGNARLSSFNPDFAWTSITNGGYSVATSQAMQSITESQASLTGKYAEELTYQGTMTLPTAPDLSYGGSNITMALPINGSQFSVAQINGVSVLSTLNGQSNGTFVFGSVNPNNPNSIIIQFKLTQAQWNASSGAPSFFSVRGLEYYWWVGLIGALSAIGLGAAAMTHFGGDEEALKIPKGKFGR